MTKKVIGSDLIHLAQLCCKNSELPVDQIQAVFLGIPFSLVYVPLQTQGFEPSPTDKLAPA